MIRKDHVALIFCRGGSKGIPKKNLQKIAGRSLLEIAVSLAKNSKYISEVFVSTDDSEIANCARSFGAGVINRPLELASDTSPEILSWKHAITHLKAKLKGTFISVPTTTPLKNLDDLNRGVERFYDGGADLVFSVSKSQRSPYLNIVTKNADGFLEVAIPDQKFDRRQDTPTTYDVTTCFYVGHTDYILRCRKLMDGRVAAVEVPPNRALDIDTPFDLKIARAIIEMETDSFD